MTETFQFKKRIYTVLLLGQLTNTTEKRMHLWTGFAYRLEDAEQTARQTAIQTSPEISGWSLSIHTQVDIEKIIEEYEKTVPQENKPKSVLEAGCKIEYAKEEPSDRNKLMTKIIKGGKRAFNKHKDELTPVEQRYLEVKMKIK